MKSPLLLLSLLLLLGACRTSPLGQTELKPDAYRIEGSVHTEHVELVQSAYVELVELGRGVQREAHAYDAAYSMERLLRNTGYPDATVDFEMEGDVAVFQVEEGMIAGIGTVRFEGVESLPQATLRKFFDFEGSGLLGNGPVLYPDAEIQSAAANVKSYYLSKGYHRVEVGKVRRERGKDETCMDLVIPVTEGRVYRVRTITTEGDDPPQLKTQEWEGKPFHGGVTAAVVSRVRNSVLNEGYPFAQFERKVEVDDEAAAVDIKVIVKRGEQTRLDWVKIEGQRRTNLRFLRRRIPMVRGQLLRKDALHTSISNVYATGVFDSLDMTLEPTQPGYADLLLKVRESESRQVDFGVGWGSWELLRGTVTYRDYNFLGRGQFFQAQAIAAVRRQSIDVAIEDPWILGKQNVLTWKGGLIRREEQFYTTTGAQTELFVERRLSDRVRVRAGYLFRAEEANDIDTNISGDALLDVEGLSRSAGLWTDIRWDTRDHLFLPTKGGLVEGGLFWSTPALAATLNYLGVKAATSYHVSLGSGSVLAFGGAFTSKEILNGAPTLPIQERLFLGGNESVRAYGRDQLTPTDPSGNGTGGLTTIEGNIELRQRVLGDFYGALFYDIGMTSLASFDVNGAWGHGPGVGFRYYTPVGPVRLDIAYNPGQLHAASRRLQVFFSFGFSF